MKLKFKKEKKEIFLRDGYNIYAETGEKVEAIQVPRDAIVILFTNQVYHLKRAKKSRGKYVYKLKNGEWIISNDLTTTFLREVLFDYYGKNAIVVDAKRIAITLFGEEQEYKVFPKSEIPDDRLEEEKKNFYNSVYQGVDYIVVPVEEALNRVIQKSKLIYILPVAVLVILAGGYFLFAGGGGEEELPPPTKPHKVKHHVIKYSESDLKISRTRQILQALVEVQNNLKPWWYIEQIDFGGGVIKLRSMLPDEGFKKNGNWFEGMVRIPLKVKPQTVDYSNWQWCLNEFAKEGAEIKANLPDRVRLTLKKKEITWEEIKKVLNLLNSCPVYAIGTIKALYPPEKAQLKLTITLYKKRT
jgi:hypothetical protein